MSAFKGTPGPWKVVDLGIWDISVEADGTVAHVNNKGEWFPSDGGESTSGRSHNTMLADARLIAAAPELLEACQTALAFVAGWAGAYRHDHGLPDFHPRHKEAIDQVKSAIAKATGGDA